MMLVTSCSRMIRDQSSGRIVANTGSVLPSKRKLTSTSKEKKRYTMNDLHTEWELLTPEEKRKQLFLKQKKTLELFLERNAISKAQYDKSLGDLIEKMGMQNLNDG